MLKFKRHNILNRELPSKEEAWQECSKILIAEDVSTEYVNAFQIGFEACLEWVDKKMSSEKQKAEDE